MTKILSINSSSSIKGGADRFFFELNKLLSEKNNHVVTFTTYSDTSDATRSGQKAYYTKEYITKGGVLLKIKNFIRIFYAPAIVKDLKKVIKKEKPEIAHIHNIYHRIPYAIVRLLKKNNVKIVWWLHDYKWICPNHQLYTGGHLCTLCIDGKYARAVILRCQKKSLFDSIIVTLFSYFIRFMHYSSYVDMFVAPSGFSYATQKKQLPNSTILHHFNYCNINDMSNAEYQVESDNNESFALYVGRIEQNKGIEILVNAFSKMKFQLKIVGDGNYNDQIKTYCDEQKITNIAFEGFKTPEELSTYYQNALFTIVPSQWYEVFGLTILESFSFGKPVLASNIGAIPEIIEDKKSGLLFEPFDIDDLIAKINYMFSNKPIVRKMGTYARQECLRKFSKDLYYEKLQSIQKQILN